MAANLGQAQNMAIRRTQIVILMLLAWQKAFAYDDAETLTIGQRFEETRAVCSRSNFNDFLSGFLNDPKSRLIKLDKSIKIHDLVLQNADQPALFRQKIITRENAIPLVNEIVMARSDARVSYVYEKSAKVVFLSSENLEIKKSLLFYKKDSCWLLTSMFNEVIPVPSVLSIKSDHKATSCFKAALKYEEMGSRSQGPNFYDRALYAYLCAAQNDSAKAALQAARLATSGQSRALPNQFVEKLFLQAADQGLVEAMVALAEMRCGDLRVCDDPVGSYELLSRAMLSGDRDAMNLFGVWLERGKLGKSDRALSLSCYKLAAERGSKLGATNYSRLSQELGNIDLAQCPVKGFSVTLKSFATPQ